MADIVRHNPKTLLGFRSREGAWTKSSKARFGVRHGGIKTREASKKEQPLSRAVLLGLTRLIPVYLCSGDKLGMAAPCRLARQLHSGSAKARHGTSRPPIKKGGET